LLFSGQIFSAPSKMPSRTPVVKSVRFRSFCTPTYASRIW